MKDQSIMSDASSHPARKRRFLPWLILILAAGAGYWFWQNKLNEEAKADAQSRAAEAATPRPVELNMVEVLRIKPRALTDTVKISGSIQPRELSAVRSEVSAKLNEVLVREGQAVAVGDVLARFDTFDLKSLLDEKRSNLEGARAQLILAEKTRDKSAVLRRKDIVAETNLDEAQSTYRLRVAQVQALEAQVEVATKALNDAVVLSPISGMIAERAVNPGETLADKTKMFTIVDLTRVELHGTVPAEDVPRLVPGQQVHLRVEGLDQEQPGTLVRINPVARTGTRAIPVYVDINNSSRALRGGMFGIGEVVVAETKDAIAIPASAIRRDDQGAHALVIVNDTLERRPLREVNKWSRGELVQVEGLNGDELIISAPLPGLTPGRTVKVIGPEAAAGS